MKFRKIIHLILLASMLLALGIGGNSNVTGKPTDPMDESRIPHYFGPYPNWANSPQVLTDAIVSITPADPVPVSVGNPLIDRGYPTDSAANVFVVNTNTPLATGTLTAFETWAQAGTGPSTFNAYVLRPDPSIADTYTIIFDSGPLSVSDTATGLQTYPLATPLAVQTGDLIAHYGKGISLDIGGGADTTLYPADVMPVLNQTFTFGVEYPVFSTDRTYSIAAVMTPDFVDPGAGAEATATVDPVTGGISGVTVINPGSGYLVPPTVSITAAGITPTALATATAEISIGVITSIAVDETGYGFTAPAVTITGGNPTPGLEATAVASGGVDDMFILDGGSDYTIQPLVEFSLPDLPGGTQATGAATIDANGVVNSVSVVNPGSGYTSAPTVIIWDGTPNQASPTPATVQSTIGIHKIDVTYGGEGYETPPVVTIADTVGVADKGASATATIAVRGAVTAITVTDPGAGYLTPGLKKFVDTLPGLGANQANDLGQYIPIGVPDTTTYPGSDYYEIALVQYRMKFHRDLPATLLRGYVQLSTSVVPGNQVPLSNEMLDGSSVPISEYTGVDTPHYLGPTIIASKDKPVRILFRNLLPTGSDGNLFLPVDTSLMGAGTGPDLMPLDANNVPIMDTDEGSVLDSIRNPICGEEPKPYGCFTENRATVHMHGAITPWISDGTPHQWITPAGENTPYPSGVSVRNVPDMPDPGPGAMTFFYTNQQSARLLFYHDHAWGITRLNVYAGEVAPYLITDETEQKLLASGGPMAGLGLGTPLVIQDKTFVPAPAEMAKQDPTWQYNRWGGEGNLWVPHVYMPAQNPGDPSGMSGFGRWMYGPWFWPPQDAEYPPIANPYYDPACDPNVQEFCEPALIPSTPNISVGMEAFNDTPVVNGTAYPTTTVDPKAYRYRILNGANDRFWNLSWYVADPRTGTLSEVALNPAELEAAQTDPVVFPTPDTTWSPKGPNWIQIGTEGGFLPAPAVLPAQPTTWITDPTRFDVGNVDQHSLLLAPAERADVIVDFSQFRGKTLILYNDAPAAFPARVPGYDYYTGGPDLSPAGAPTTLPGYGPNTRTIMQVKVSNAAPSVAFDRPNTTADRMGALVTAFNHHADGSGVFESGQNPIIVGQAAYNPAYGTDFVSTGWCNSPSNPTASCDGYARISEQGGEEFKFDTLFGAQLGIPLQPKGIHDEMNSATFDLWGRMSANIGLEAPGATPLLQNIILYPYVNPATEVLDSTGLPSSLDVTPISNAADGTQIWKITHNGVDTHPLHFHLYDIQLINRVAWDNIISPPDPNELGWKDTVRVNPLQDTYVALRPIVPVIPFAIPDSKRPLNPMMPLGARGDQNGVNGDQAGFNNTDANGIPVAPIINEIVNFGWEYVWHCHILSHEEMDMMRPVTVHVARALPAAPVLTYTPGSVILNWTDGTPVDYLNPLSWGDPTNEIGYRIELAIGTAPFQTIATALANVTTYTDNTVSNEDLHYRVVAYNEAGESVSNEVVVLAPVPADPTGLTATLVAGPQVDLAWTDNATNETGYVIERSLNGEPFTQLTTLPADAVSFADTTVASAATPNVYSYRVYAVNATGASGFSNTASVTLPALTVPADPTNLTAALQAGPQIALAWTDNATDETGYVVERSLNGGAFAQIATPPAVAGTGNTTYTDAAVAIGNTYAYRVYAVNGVGPSGFSNTATVTIPSTPPPAAPTNLVATLQNGSQIRLTWRDNATNETGFVIERSDNGGAFTQLTTRPARNNVGNVTYTDTTVVAGNTYAYRVYAVNAAGPSGFSNTATVTIPAVPPPAAPTNLVATLQNGPQIRLTWRDNATNETGFVIQRSVNGGAYTLLTTRPASNRTGNVSYTDTTVTAGNTYQYQVASVRSGVPSAFITSALITLPSAPAAPTALTGTAVRAGFRDRVNLSWTDNANNETGFTIQRASNATFTAGLNTRTAAANATSYSWSNLPRNTTYYFRVAATNSAGTSTWSNVFTVVTP